jgi:predicted DNA-binding transcriptional regulator YafY
MSAGKRPYPRYRVINSCLASKQQRYWSLQELLNKLAENDLFVEKRSLQYDLERMRYDEQLGYQAPIAYCARNRGYYYTEPDYSIDVVPLSSEDLRSLTFAINILQQYKGAQVVKQFEGTLDKVAKIVHQLKKSDAPSHALISFEKVPFYKGMEFFDELLRAVDEKQPLTIVYKKFNDPVGDAHVFHAYLLKEYMNRWYVLGYSEARRSIITLGLDRILSLAPAPVAFRASTQLNEENYFHHTIGITHSSQTIEEILLQFSPNQANYIKTQHLHHSQQTVHEGKDGLKIALKLMINYELISLLLSFGAEVEVLKPPGLRRKVKELLRKGWEQYG